MISAEPKKIEILTAEEKIYLLRLARYTLENYFQLETPMPEKIHSPNLKKCYGLFVTLHLQGALRGCVGFIQPVRSLYEAVPEMAVSTAVKDPRFIPLQLSELKDIDIEISVLSPMRKVGCPEEIVVGTHGLMVLLEDYRGLLLPQVAVEHQWDRETFLSHTCVKAGLDSDAWKTQPVQLFSFSAEVFSEHSMKLIAGQKEE